MLDTMSDPCCMNCKNIFNHNFIADNCTSVFITKDLKKHREDILLNREKGLLIETQPYVIIEKERIKLSQEIAKYREIVNEHHISIGKLDDKIRIVYIKMSELNNTSPSDIERRKYIKKCPLTDCRGFLSTQWNCGVCDKKVCKDCNEERTVDHICKPENVATTNLLNKDTKGCPECGTLIYKISGCSHMFCVDCKCSWDWNTQQVLKGNNTNPHYYEFMRNNGRGIPTTLQVPCNGYSLHSFSLLFAKIDKDQWYEGYSKTIISVINVAAHIELVELTRHYQVTDNILLNRSLRVKYLLGTITDDAFKIILQSGEKQNQKNTEFRNILQMFVNVARDLTTQVYGEIKTNKVILPSNIKVLLDLVDYVNENLAKAGKMFKCVYPGITPGLVYASNILR